MDSESEIYEIESDNERENRPRVGPQITFPFPFSG